MFKYFKDEKAFNIRNILNKIIVPHKITVLYFFNKIKLNELVEKNTSI